MNCPPSFREFLVIERMLMNNIAGFRNKYGQRFQPRKTKNKPEKRLKRGKKK